MMLWRNNYNLFYLCSVVEVSKLSFPTNKCKWICHTKSQLKTCKHECAPRISMETGKISLKKALFAQNHDKKKLQSWGAFLLSGLDQDH